MTVLAALGDAPTAVIAVLAILLGVFLAARGPREKRAAGPDAGRAETSGPTLLKLPRAAAPEPAPDVEPGFIGPQGEVVGHGRIRLGATTGPLGGREPTAAQPAAAPADPEPVPPEPVPQPTPEPEPEPEPERQAEPEPPAPEAPASEPARLEASPAASEQALFTSPPTLPDPPVAPQDDAAAAAPDPPPAADADGDAPEEPPWPGAAPAADSTVPFRQGTIKLGGKPVNERKDQD